MSGSIIWCTFIFRLQNYLFRLIFQYYNSRFNLILTQFVIPMIPWHQDYTNLVTSQIQLTSCGRNVHFVTYHRLFRTRYYKQLKYRHLEILRYHDWYFACDTKKREFNDVTHWTLSGERGIRTPGTSRYGSFQDYCNRPLYHLSSARLSTNF